MIITTNNTGLRIELHGREQVLALRAKIDVPRDCIKTVRFEPIFQDWRKWEVRMPGTHAPKLILAGSYWTEEGWDFLYVKRPRGLISPRVENVLVIETDQNRYTRVIVTIEAGDADRVLKWWNRKPVKAEEKPKVSTKSTAKTSKKKT
jgi:hypothetical protein